MFHNSVSHKVWWGRVKSVMTFADTWCHWLDDRDSLVIFVNLVPEGFYLHLLFRGPESAHRNLSMSGLLVTLHVTTFSRSLTSKVGNP